MEKDPQMQYVPNPWDMPAEIYLCQAASSFSDKTVVGVFLSEERARYFVACLKSAYLPPRGTYDDPENLVFTIEHFKQRCVAGGPRDTERDPEGDDRSSD